MSTCVQNQDLLEDQQAKMMHIRASNSQMLELS